MSEQDGHAPQASEREPSPDPRPETAQRPGTRGALSHLDHSVDVPKFRQEMSAESGWADRDSDESYRKWMATRRIPPMDDEDTDWESVTAAPWRVSPIPLEPPGQHHPEDEPDTCAEAALHELAGAKMSGEERQQTLDHGLRAVHELVRQLREARHWARLAWLLADTEEMVDPPAWLTGPPEDDPTWRGGASGQPHVARTVTGMSDDEQPVGEWAEDENGYSQEFSDWANRSMESYRARRLAAFQEDVVEGLRQSGQTGPLPDDLLEDRAADESLEFEFDEDTQIRPADLGSVLQGPPPSAGKVRQASEDAYGSWSWQHADDEEPPQEPSS